MGPASKWKRWIEVLFLREKRSVETLKHHQVGLLKGEKSWFTNSWRQHYIFHTDDAVTSQKRVSHQHQMYKLLRHPELSTTISGMGRVAKGAIQIDSVCLQA